MEIYFEHLINATYRAYQDILIKKHGDILSFAFRHY